MLNWLTASQSLLARHVAVEVHDAGVGVDRAALVVLVGDGHAFQQQRWKAWLLA